MQEKEKKLDYIPESDYVDHRLGGKFAIVPHAENQLEEYQEDGLRTQFRTDL